MTPVKQRKTEVAPLLFSNKKRTIEFDQVIDQVKDALAHFNAFEYGIGTNCLTEDELDVALEENPNLIIPFMAEMDDYESEFTMPMKKCRKPRAKA